MAGLLITEYPLDIQEGPYWPYDYEYVYGRFHHFSKKTGCPFYFRQPVKIETWERGLAKSIVTSPQLYYPKLYY